MYNDVEMISSINRSHEEKKRINNYQEYLKELERVKKIKFTFAATITTFTILATGFSLCKTAYENTIPINAATIEIARDTDMCLTDNGRVIDGTMTKEELVNLVDSNDISEDELIESLTSYANKYGYDAEVMIEKAKETNPEVFSSRSR